MITVQECRILPVHLPPSMHYPACCHLLSFGNAAKKIEHIITLEALIRYILLVFFLYYIRYRYKGLLVYFSPFFLAILVDRAYGPKKSVNFSLEFAVF